MNEVTIGFTREELQQFVDLSKNDNDNIKQIAKSIMDKCQSQGIEYNEEQTEITYFPFFEKKSDYIVVNHGNEYFVIGDNDWFSKSYKTEE
jgi:hypothetical protein